MIPKWLPVVLPMDCAPFGEHPFQPYNHKTGGYAVAGGPSALFLVSLSNPPEFALKISARVRISGWAQHEGMLYVQDGPVLSRWGITDRRCLAAINVLTKQRFSGTGQPNWDQLHNLDTAEKAKQTKLQNARRKVEWLRLLETTEKLLALPSTRTADQTTRLQQLAADLKDLLGPNSDALREELSKAETDAAAHIFSAPVVRTIQTGAPADAMVFVIGRDGTIHPIDKELKEMDTIRPERNVRPSLAIAEVGDAQGADYSCWLYFVTGEGKVCCVDGNSFKVLDEWPGQGPTSLEPGVRMRVESNLVWGNNAQFTGIFALPIDRPGAASRINVPSSQDWRWLEIRPESWLALVGTENSCRLISYAPNTKLPDRFAVKPDRAPYFSSFLPAFFDERTGEKRRPLLVAEFERDASRAGGGVVLRLLVANDVDVLVPGTPEAYAPFYPPLPTAILETELAGRETMGPPVRIRTQPTVSDQEAYLMARDKTIHQQLLDLATNTWTPYMASLVQRYGSRANASAALGNIELPALSGKDALYCYAIGKAVTDVQARRAFAVLADMVELSKAARLSIVQTVYRIYGSRILPESTTPLRSCTVTLRYDDGRKFNVTTNTEGRALLSPDCHGKFLTMEPLSQSSSFLPNYANRVFITREADNKIEYVVHKEIGEK